MVLSTKRPWDAASDAVQVSEKEAFGIQTNFLWNWVPRRDVWPLTLGPFIAGGVAGLSGILINNHYRRWLRLGRWGRFSSYAPVALLPVATTVFCQFYFVTKPIVLSKTTCPLCLELRSIGIQSSLGVLYPMVLAPLAAFRMANGYRTYPVPRMLRDSGEVFRLYLKFTRLGQALFVAILAFNLALASTLPYLEFTSYHKWLVMLGRLEADFDEKVAKGELTHPSDEPKFLREAKSYPPYKTGEPRLM